MTKEEFENKIKRPAIKFLVGGYKPDDSLTASWVGNVSVKIGDESWPISNGLPMIPICQLNLSELPDRPENLNDIKLITLFVDLVNLPEDTPNGQGWLIRTYTNLNELEEIEKPDTVFPIKPFQLKPEYIESDFPKWEDCPVNIPEEFEKDYYDLFPNQEGIKIGGWPTLVQSEIFWAPYNEHPAEPEYVFQIDSIEKANWVYGEITV